jgi:hypothetical protein
MVVRRMLLGIVLLTVGTIVSLLFAAMLIYGIAKFGVIVAVIAVLLVVILLTVLVVKVALERNGTRWNTVTRLTADEPLYEHPCTHCSGGAQTLYGGEWVPIPMHLRIIQDGVRTFEPPRGNVRSCPECNGRGSFLLPYPPQDLT